MLIGYARVSTDDQNLDLQRDVLTVWRLDRLGRSLHDLILLSRKLDEAGIGLISVQEKIDTSGGVADVNRKDLSVS